jgi:PilX N-terminal
MSNRPAPHDAVDPRPPSERGAALVFALFGLATLTVLGLGLTSMGMMATKMTSNERDTQQAIALADAGLAHARKLITFQEWDASNMTMFLIGGDGVACNGDELSQAPVVPAPAGYPTLFIQSAATGGQAYGAGSYRVYVCDDHLTDRDPDTNVLDANPNADVNKRVIVRSVGTTANGATATVEQVFGANTVPALLVNGPLSVRGDVNVTGSGGIIHSNGTMDIVGNSVCAEQYFSSTQQITGGIPEGGAGCNEDGEVRPGSAPINIRQITPSNYRYLADYWLTTQMLPNGPGGALRVNGLVKRNTSANHPALSDADFTNVPTPAGWSFTDNRYQWSTNGGNATEMPRAIYYATTNVSLGGNVDATVLPPPVPVAPMPGSTAGMTILADGWVDIGGGAHLVGKLSVTSIGLMTIVAGTDIQVGGNAGCGAAVCHVGLYYARHQIEMTGTPVVSGQVVALNQADTIYPTAAFPGVNAINLVPLVFGYMKISGNPTINYSGGGMTGTAGLTWRECRSNPADVDPGMAGLIAVDDACGNLFGG